MLTFTYKFCQFSLTNGLNLNNTLTQFTNILKLQRFTCKKHIFKSYVLTSKLFYLSLKYNQGRKQFNVSFLRNYNTFFIAFCFFTWNDSDMDFRKLVTRKSKRQFEVATNVDFYKTGIFNKISTFHHFIYLQMMCNQRLTSGNQQASDTSFNSTTTKKESK